MDKDSTKGEYNFTDQDVLRRYLFPLRQHFIKGTEKYEI